MRSVRAKGKVGFGERRISFRAVTESFEMGNARSGGKTKIMKKAQAAAEGCGLRGENPVIRSGNAGPNAAGGAA